MVWIAFSGIFKCSFIVRVSRVTPSSNRISKCQIRKRQHWWNDIWNYLCMSYLLEQKFFFPPPKVRLTNSRRIWVDFWWAHSDSWLVCLANCCVFISFQLVWFVVGNRGNRSHPWVLCVCVFCKWIKCGRRRSVIDRFQYRERKKCIR